MVGRRDGRAAREAAFRAYLAEAARRSGVPLRRLSEAMGRDPGYLAQFLGAEPGKTRGMPTPEELKAAAPLLGVPLLELLERGYGIRREDLAPELETVAGHRAAWADQLEALGPEERRTVLAFLAFVAAQGAADDEDGR